MRLINQRPGRGEKIVLGALPFVVLVVAYVIGSHIRLAAIRRQAAALARADAVGDLQLAFVPEARSGDYLLWADTAASLARLLGGIAISALIALGLGIPAGLIPRARAGAGAVRRRDFADPADHHPADPVHRLRPRRDLQDGTDRRSAPRR